MKNSSNKLTLFFSNFIFVGFLVMALVCYWAINAHRLDTAVNFYQVIPAALAIIIAITALRMWLSIKLAEGKN